MANSVDRDQTAPRGGGIRMLWVFLAYRIRKSEVFAWDRNSYLTHIISHQNDNFNVNSVCNGCIGYHIFLS